jgi:UPF0716 protein FxsA
MFLRLLLLFILVPFIELAILLKINSFLGLGATLGLVILTGFVGAALAKHQGLKTWQRIQSDLSMGIVPSGRLIDGALILVAGLLLVTPGLLTDLVGFSLLLPPLRDRIKRGLRQWAERKIASGEIQVRFGPPGEM